LPLASVARPVVVLQLLSPSQPLIFRPSRTGLRRKWSTSRGCPRGAARGGTRSPRPASGEQIAAERARMDLLLVMIVAATTARPRMGV
jgi:hypothetical protein